MSISSVIEIISIGAIAPFLGALTSPDYIFQHELMKPVNNFLGIQKSKDLLFPLTFFFILTIILSGIFRISVLWLQTRTIHLINADLSSSIFKRIIHQSYNDHLSRNSSEIIAAIVTKSNTLLANLLHPVLVIINAVLMIGLAIFLMMAIDPYVLLIFPIVVLIYILILVMMKNSLLKYSYTINYESSHIVKIIQESLGTVRDIIIDGTQNYYFKIFNKAEYRNQNTRSKIKIISGMPRLVIEPLGMIIIVLTSYFYIQNIENPLELIAFLGMLALGAQKMLPILQNAYTSISSIRGGHKQVEEALNLLDLKIPNLSKKKNTKLIVFNNYIELSKINFNYPSENHKVLQNLDLTIKKGERVGIIGPTGSGKSTLLDIILGLLIPTSGEIFIDDVRIDKNNILGWHKNLAHIPQDVYISDNTIYENIALGVDYNKIDKDIAHNAAEQAKISSSIHSMKKGFDTIVGENGSFLSGGQRQRIGIARALYKKANVIMLDEATSALDDKTEREVLSEVCSLSRDITVIMITHRLSALKSFDKIVKINEGRISQIGTFSDVVNN
ncbi:ABC transporter ATP-binding protein/permease [Candidatus Pelagibacter ubique]|nr:ABC transporter ATP-binding protein/permease [Candidatus Pelagibacter ubique]